MNRLDLNAPIVPNKSAAGFILGIHFNELTQLAEINGLIVENMEPYLDKIISFLMKETSKEVIRLHFNDNGILYQIFISEGYYGKLFETLSIGSTYKQFLNYMSVFYDDGDELFYPDENSSIHGLAFLTEYYEDHDDSPVILISVHDYGLMRGENYDLFNVII